LIEAEMEKIHTTLKDYLLGVNITRCVTVRAARTVPGEGHVPHKGGYAR
jgi:hypothetical protein